jgi:hypothetical protein
MEGKFSAPVLEETSHSLQELEEPERSAQQQSLSKSLQMWLAL